MVSTLVTAESVSWSLGPFVEFTDVNYSTKAALVYPAIFSLMIVRKLIVLTPYLPFMHTGAAVTTWTL